MIYVHTPFCASKCIYCDFNSYAGQESLIDEYTSALVNEVKTRAGKSRKISTIYFGGGNPLLLGAENLTKIMKVIYRYYDVDKDAEISIEANPEDADKRLLSGCLASGFNRLSLGLQSFDNNILKMLWRRHTAKQSTAAYKNGRAAGFTNINIDLIFGLPGQSLEEWRWELEQATALEPSHISAYGLSVEPGTPLYFAVNKGHVSIPDEESQARMMEDTHSYLSDAYHHYEISNFARLGFECRHNLNYWLGKDYLGFGAGAYSCLNDERFFNILRPEKYIRAVISHGHAVAETEALTERQRLAESIFLGLRLVDGFKIKSVEDKFCCTLDKKYSREIGLLTARGLLEVNDSWRLTPRGRLLANEVMSEFV